MPRLVVDAGKMREEGKRCWMDYYSVATIRSVGYMETIPDEAMVVDQHGTVYIDIDKMAELGLWETGAVTGTVQEVS